ncbi:MAG TPA: double zinc ribbon domain-containing protein [Opitutaceae bacterium]|nr:double zinc ribbon domain-containing protein [Opitutaceae bacterium]
MMAGARTFLSRLARDALDVVFPRTCVECGGLVDGGWLRHVCETCARLFVIARGPHCTTCGHPFFGEMAGNRLCPHCEELRPVFREGRTAILLKGPGRTLVHALKYHRGLHVLEDVTAIMSATPGYADYLRDAVLVPVPLHPRKLREREYNQSRLLADCAVRASGGTARIEELLRRAVDTVSQTRFDRAERARNLKNAFALAPGARFSPRQRYVLLDDVFTTGSTLNSCAAVLRGAGLKNLDVVTFGHG